MTSHRFFAAFLLLGFAFLLYGCGSSSKSIGTPPPTNNPLTVEGNWTIKASVGSNSSSFNANIVVLTPQSGSCVVKADGWTFQLESPTTCFIAYPGGGQGSITNVSQSGWDYPPAGFMFESSAADPVPANTTANMAGYLVESNGTNVEVIDLYPGTITASTKTISGTFYCDPGSSCGFSGNGTFTATHQ